MKFPNLPAASALTGSEIVPLTQGGVDKRTTAEAIANMADPEALGFSDSGFTADNVHDAIVEASTMGPGGTATWGAIAGTLLNQTDLQSALDAKVAVSDLAASTGALAVGYDNTASGLIATDVQAAIDEVAAGGGGGAVSSVNGQTGTVVLGLDDLDDVNAAAPSDGDVLTWNNTAGEWVPEAPSGGGGGLTDWTEGVNSTSPNDTVPVVSLTATNAASDVDAAIAPKGAGAFFLGPPSDGTSTGGNKRGARAIDLQLFRASAIQVASGSQAIAIGSSCRASGSRAIAIGDTTAATVDFATAIGSSNTASGNSSVALGNTNIASGLNAITIGNGNQASANQAVAIGDTAQATGINAFVTGVGTYDRGMQGVRVHGRSATKQHVQWMGDRLTTDATPERLSANGSGTSDTHNYNLASGMAACLFVQIIARQFSGTGAGSCAAWTAHVLLKNIGGTTSIVGTVTPTQIAADAGAAAWAISITADDTTETLNITVTGEASKSIQWEALVSGPEA